MKEPYKEALIKKLNAIKDDASEILENIETFEEHVAIAILDELLVTACKCQHYGNIFHGRSFLDRIPIAWLDRNIDDAVKRLGIMDDDYEYRRLIEYLRERIPFAAARFIEIGLTSDRPDIREAAMDFKGG